MRKAFRILFFTLAALAAVPTLTLAQPELDALTFGVGINGVGYFTPMTGWTFVPTTDLRVVSVGYSSVVDGSGLRINFWEGTNHIIATYPIVQGFQTNAVLYQSVDGVTLRANAQYGISVENPYSDSLPVAVYSRQGDDGSATFDTSPFLTQFALFQVSTNGLWSPLPFNGDVLYLGATFQFALVSKLTIGSLGNSLLLSWPTSPNSFAVQQNLDLNPAHWTTLTNTPIVLGSENQISLPKPTGIIFYRLIAQ